MSRYVSIGPAAKLLGVSISTLRRWEREGRIRSERTPAGHRRYDTATLEVFSSGRTSGRPKPCGVGNRKTIAYARVSSRDQKADLERQKQVLEMFCAARGWTCEVIADLGSGMNYRKKGLMQLLHLLISGSVARLVITRQDRLLRFGAELVFAVCEMKNVEVVIVNQGDESSFEEDLAKDVLEIITVFSARLYGSRNQKNKKLIENLKDAAKAAEAEE